MPISASFKVTVNVYCVIVLVLCNHHPKFELQRRYGVASLKYSFNIVCLRAVLICIDIVVQL